MPVFVLVFFNLLALYLPENGGKLNCEQFWIYNRFLHVVFVFSGKVNTVVLLGREGYHSVFMAAAPFSSSPKRLFLSLHLLFLSNFGANSFPVLLFGDSLAVWVEKRQSQNWK